ncbi:VaFE repeat-containing surface-anchored protein, partial [Enterococcus columbae]
MKMKAKYWYAYILFMLVGLLAGGMNIRAANIDDYFNSDYYYGYPEGNTGGNYGKDVNHSPLALINKLEIAGAKYYVKEVVYCLNEEIKPPSSEQTPFKSDGSYKNNFDVFLKLNGAREQLYKRKTPNRGNTDEEIKWVTKNSKDNGADTRKVLWNGYPVDAIGLKEKYGLSDMQFQAVTQAAIWYYTSDHGGITDRETLLNDYKKKFNNTNFQWTEASSRVYRILTGEDTSVSLDTPDANFEVYIYETAYPNNVQRLISVGIRGGASVKVTKKWIGSPADKITINLLANGKKIRSQVLTAENKKGNDWVYQFTGLPQYDSKWQKIKYTVTEDSLSGYSSTIAGDATTGFVITNKRTKTYTNPKQGQLATTVSVKNNESTTPVRLLSKDTQGVEVTDTVSYSDLVGGKVYELTGTLMHIKADGSTEAIASESKEVTAETSGKGTWELTFAPQNLKAGEKYVVYEVAKSKENLVDSNKDDEPDTKHEVRHENPQDEAQTIVVNKEYTNPKEGQLATTVSVKNNESTTPVRLLSKDTQGVEVTDTVSYSDLVGGKVYELTGTLMQIKADGSTEAIASASKEVTAETSGKGTWELTFAPQNLKAGEKYVVYEVAKSKENLVDSNKDDEPDTKHEVRHENPQDEAQTIVVNKEYTNPKEGQLATTVSVKNNESTTPVRLLSKDTQGVEVTDTVSYSDLVGGKVYELTGTLMQIKADGSTEAIASASKEVTAETSGKGTWELTFAPQNLKAGEKYVVYEVAKSKENLVDSNKDDEPDTKQEVRHENPQDEAQTIVVSKPTRPRPTPPKPIVPKTVISKQNLGGEEIAGASIQIKDTTGKVIEAWISQAGQSHQLTLSAGTYVFHEEAAPTGYLKVTDITFSVDDKGIVTIVQDTTTSHASKVENNRLVVVD